VYLHAFFDFPGSFSSSAILLEINLSNVFVLNADTLLYVPKAQRNVTQAQQTHAIR